MSETMCRKQERHARDWAYEQHILPEGVITAWNDFVRAPRELTEYFGVMEQFYWAAIDYL